MVNLYRMRQLMRQVPRKLWQIEQENAKATKITTVLTGMPRGGSGKNQVEDGAIKLTELKEAFAEVANELHYMQLELAPLISELDNPDDRAAMRLRYIEGYSPEDIAEAIHRTDRSIYYYLSRAENELCRNHPDKVKANG
ncbi:MAG: sigma-70 region 4 domain-containing protein [Clostridia bacterium]|nr:sigma-70 region 4 domain-containing protein [Clostridia bacterium]